MTLIRPFRGLRPKSAQAQELVAPPYDVLNSEEARQLAEGHPLSFLHISKPEIDLSPEVNPYTAEVYQKGAENLNRLIADGVLSLDDQAAYYLYEMLVDGHSQIGLVAVASVEKYDQNLIVKHELTRQDKEADRINMISTMDCQASPVLLTFAPEPSFSDIVAQVCAQPAETSVLSTDQVTHRLWPVFDPSLIEGISAIFNGPNAPVNKLYIADGHHRSASASKIAAERIPANPDHTGDEPYNYFLAVIYPSDQMKILDYNRVVKDLNGHSVTEFLAKLEEWFEVKTSDKPLSPASAGQIGMYLKNQWYQLTADPAKIPQDPVGVLDVSLLYQWVLSPLLGIGNPRTDKRIDFVGGARGLKGLEMRVDSKEMQVAFSMFPTQMQQIMDVAEADQIMPPKSTWFEPKLVDGLICHWLKE